MKKNNIRKMAIMLALVQALTLGGCKSNTNVASNTNDSKPGIEYEWTELVLGYRKLENDDTYYKLVQERFDPIVTYTMEPVTSTTIVNGKSEKVITYHQVATYSAPSICNVTVGSGSNLECYHVYYKQITEEEYEQDKLMGIVIDFSYWYDEEGRLYETKELNPIVTRNEDGTTTYSAPSCATRVEGSGPTLRCFIDSLIEEPEKANSIILGH